MGTRTSYKHGTPSWVDLMTPDTQKAREFFGTLLGWTFDEQPAGDDGQTYIMCFKDGHAVAGIMTLSEEMQAGGMPPAWTTYITVDDIKETVAKIAPAGGTVMQEPFDVMEAGTMAVVADPAGATFALWQPNQHIGAGLVNEPGALCWNELISTDLEASTKFYAEVFGWGADVADMGNDMLYTSFTVDGSSVAGGMKPPMDGMPSFWGVYFDVEDCDASLATAKEAGATIMSEPVDIPGVGRMAPIADPTGAMVSIIHMPTPSP